MTFDKKWLPRTNPLGILIRGWGVNGAAEAEWLGQIQPFFQARSPPIDLHQCRVPTAELFVSPRLLAEEMSLVNQESKNYEFDDDRDYVSTW
jgi:hypothetical protein